MTEWPTCSVITPTWQRHDLLFSRAIPSVAEQVYRNIEHIIVSDGPDKELAYRLSPNGPDGARNRWFFQLPEHDPWEHWGAEARLAGLEYASGDLIAYCDDDDSLRKSHCSEMAAALLFEHKDAGFAISRMMAHGGPHDTVIGHGPLGIGNVGSPMIMHRRSILDIATWGKSSRFEDWDLVEKWLAAGVKYANIDAETVDVWPSKYRQGN